MDKKTRMHCMNTLVCCMKQKNGKVKTENYPPPPRSALVPPVSGGQSKRKTDLRSLMSKGDCFSLMSVGELIKVKTGNWTKLIVKRSPLISHRFLNTTQGTMPLPL